MQASLLHEWNNSHPDSNMLRPLLPQTNHVFNHIFLAVATQNTTTTAVSTESDALDSSQNASSITPTQQSAMALPCREQDKAVEVFNTVAILFTVALGLFGNTLSFLILWLQSKKSTMNLMLMILALVDNFYILSVFMVYILQNKLPDKVLFRVNVTVVSRISQSLSAWTIIIIGVIRLLAIRRPLQVKTICTPMRCMLAVAGVAILIIAIHIPQFNYNFPFWNASFQRIYFGICYYFLFMFLIPFTILLILNFLLLKSLRRNDRPLLQETKHHIQEHTDITRVVMAIITVFLISYCGFAFFGILNFSRTVRYSFLMTGHCIHKWILVIIAILLYMNSSVNFFIYFVLRKSFRKNLKKLLPDRPTSRRSSDTSQMVSA